jgi:hypothetical protein
LKAYCVSCSLMIITRQSLLPSRSRQDQLVC